MRILTINLVLTFLFLLFGCKKTTTEPTEREAVLAVELGITYQNDSVLVQLDNKTLYSGNATTNFVLSDAWLSGPMKSMSGNHNIRPIMFNEGVQAEKNLGIKDTSTVLINYDRSSKTISFEQFDMLLVRD